MFYIPQNQIRPDSRIVSPDKVVDYQMTSYIPGLSNNNNTNNNNNNNNNDNNNDNMYYLYHYYDHYY